MSHSSLAGVVPTPSLDIRLRTLLRDLPEAQVALVEEFMRERERQVVLAERRAGAAAHEQLLSEALRDKRQSEALAELASRLGASVRLAEILRLSLRHSAAILGAQGAAVAFRRDDYLHIVATEGCMTPVQGLYMPVTGSATGQAMVAGHALVLNDAASDGKSYERVREAAGIEKVVSAPLLTPDGPLGLLTVVNRAQDFTNDDARVLQRLATQLALAVVNARLYEEANDATRELSVAFEAIAGGMAVLDSEGFILRHNARLVMLAGEARGTSLVGRALFEALLREPRELTVHDPLGAAIQHHIVGRGTVRQEWTGKTFDLVASPHPAGGAVVTVDDVTSFHTLSERYRNLVEVAADAIYTLDVHGAFTSANAACEELTGLPREALLGRSIMPLLEPSETAELSAHFLAARAGETRRYECHLVRPDGTARLVSVSNTPVRHGAQVVGVLGVARDVTDDRARAAALERAESRYSRLVESAEDAICTLDEEGNFTSVNRSLERVMGVPRESLIGTHFTALVAPEQGTHLWHMFVATLAGHPQREELRFTNARGAVGVANAVTAPLFEHGKVAGVLAIIRDVTEERSLMEQVVRREKLAALGELVGGVAHEVNSPLTSILAFGQMIKDESVTGEEGLRAADTIVNEAKRAARIVSKLLTFARQNPPERMPTELNQVLLDTIELRRYPLKMQQISLSIELAEDLPPTMADPFQLQQVFINLLSNAEQALMAWPGERKITVRTECRGAELVATIADTGPGIAPEHVAHIFNPFYTTKPRGVGTGLGLSISFGIVREHRGVLRVHSEPERGAAFEVVLPLVAPHSPTAS